MSKTFTINEQANAVRRAMIDLQRERNRTTDPAIISELTDRIAALEAVLGTLARTQRLIAAVSELQEVV